MKKLLALCLTVLLVVAMVPVFAVSADATPTIVVSDAEGFSGDSVTVNVTLANNPGIVSAYLEVAYDAAVLELTEVVAGADFDAMMSYSESLSANPYVLNYADGKTKVDITATDFATLTFAIKADAAVGDTAVSITFDPENVFDVNMDAVNFEIDNGVVTVKCAHANTTVVGAKDATCTEAGYTGDVVCACGETVEAGKAIDAKGHTEVTEGAKDATCTEAGSTGTIKCSVCDVTVKEAEVIDAKGHTETTVGAKAATCEDEGYTGDKVCSVCDEVLEKGEVIAALGHGTILEVAAKDATCDEDGNIAHYACETCGATFADEDGAEAIDVADVIIEKLGHKYADGKCTVCDEDEPKEEEKPADKEEKPADTEKPAEKPNTDDGNKAPATNDVSNIFVVVAMLMAIAAAAVVVLKKKA